MDVDAEIAGDQRHAIAGRAEEQRLSEAHDAGIAPHQIEREREQAEDQDPRGVDGQIIRSTSGSRAPIASTTISMTGSNRHRRERSILMGSLRAGGVVSVIKLPAD